MNHIQEFEQELNAVGQDLKQVCHQFILGYSTSDMPETTYQLLLRTLNEKGVVMFSRLLRQEVLIALNKTFPPSKTQAVWNMIDTIGFWEDAHPGRWKYTQLKDFQRYLSWVRQGICQFQWESKKQDEYLSEYIPNT